MAPRDPGSQIGEGSGRRVLAGCAAVVVGAGLLWFGYATELVAERTRREFVQDQLSAAATQAADPGRLRAALDAAVLRLDRGEVRLSSEAILDARVTLQTLAQDAARRAEGLDGGTVPPSSADDSTLARIELLRLVARLRDGQAPPDRWTGRAGLLLLAAGLALLWSARPRRTIGASDPSSSRRSVPPGR